MVSHFNVTVILQSCSIEWYESKDIALSERFDRSFRRTINLIKSNPEMFQEIGGGQRRAVLSSPFPYSIYYSMDKERGVIKIEEVLHQSKNRELKKELELTQKLKEEKRV